MILITKGCKKARIQAGSPGCPYAKLVRKGLKGTVKRRQQGEDPQMRESILFLQEQTMCLQTETTVRAETMSEARSYVRDLELHPN